ncbi:MAG: hypothetical protein ABIH82_00190 [Candidatus Woesearchaeota archaeon]
MKLIFAEEDSVYGILMGVLIIGLSGKYFNVPDLPSVWGAMFCISLLFSALDFAHAFTRFSRHIGIVILHFANIVIDIVLEVSFISMFFKFEVPFISTMTVPLLQAPETLFIVGIFYVVSNVFWVVAFPMTQ